MQYSSTRGQRGALSASQAIIKGIADDGGLYVPQSIPVLTVSDMDALAHLDYKQTAEFVLSKFLTDFSADDISRCVQNAYTTTAFAGGEAPIVALGDNVHVLELWHGPTCAFKDMALQLMPHLMVTSLRMQGTADTAVILAATSGDTGKAALDGFSGVDGVKIAVFYPDEGVSTVQKRQMTTQRGDNVAVAAVRGNFDDTQNAVKEIFADGAFNRKLAQHGMFLTSANSINWGRLVPQIVYYVYLCAQLEKSGVANGKAIDICVPTGNFGNILACFYAKKMGAPIGKLICASNSNHILTDFLQTGTYDRNRDFIKTMSPSMDILISSNLERLLFELSGRDGAYIAGLMQQLKETGSYTVSGDIKQQLDDLFTAGFCDDDGTAAEIRRVWDSERYLLDTHTAVASAVLHRHPTTNPAVIVSTASPFKFAANVLRAISGDAPADDMEAVGALARATGLDVPAGLRDIDKLPVLHKDVIDNGETQAWLEEKLL